MVTGMERSPAETIRANNQQQRRRGELLILNALTALTWRIVFAGVQSRPRQELGVKGFDQSPLHAVHGLCLGFDESEEPAVVAHMTMAGDYFGFVAIAAVARLSCAFFLRVARPFLFCLAISLASSLPVRNSPVPVQV